jgi:quercetin dioxygenase-like cupin family protein
MHQMSGQPVTSAFLNFVLQRTRVKTNVCSRQKTEQGYKLQRRTVPDYNFIWIDRGRAVWVVEETPHELSVGDLIIVPPGVEHYAYSTTRRMTMSSPRCRVASPYSSCLFPLAFGM